MGHCIIFAFVHLEVQKVLQKIAKKKGYDCLLEWIKPCANHLYWCATTTLNGDGQVIWDKFESFFSHIIDKHQDLTNKWFNRCARKENITDRKWLLEGIYVRNVLNSWKLGVTMNTCF